VLIPRRSSPGVLRVLTSAAVLLVGFVIVTVLSLGPLVAVDEALNYPWRNTWPELFSSMEVIVRLGQRAVCLPVLFVVAALVARQRRSWEPVILAAVGALAVNLVVGVLKLSTMRGHPMVGDPDFFEQGIMYPSGHAANAIMVYGLATYLARTFHGRHRLPARLLLTLTWAAAVAMILTGVYFQWHWFTDLVGGLLIGGAVLRMTVYGHRRARAFLAASRRQVPAVGASRIVMRLARRPAPGARRDVDSEAKVGS
jgi:membrane-associated phospholipid phosphatase